MPDVTELKRRLQGFLLDKQPAQIAETYRAIVEQEPDFCFVPGVQFDLGRYLERGGYPHLALRAYDVLIANHPGAPIAARALLQASRLCAFLPNQEDRGLQFIEAFLRTSPADPEREEAARLLSAFRGETGLVTPLPNDCRPTAAPGPPAQSYAAPSIPPFKPGAPRPPAPAPPSPRRSAIAASGAPRSMSDSDVMLKDPEPPGQPAHSEIVHLNLEEVQRSLAPAPPEGAGGLFIDDIASEVSGHEIFFEFAQEKSDTHDRPWGAPGRLSEENIEVKELDDDLSPSPLPSLRPIAGEAIPSPAAPPDDEPAIQPARPSSASQFLHRAEELQQHYDEQRRREELARHERLSTLAGKSFAIILPLHRHIHPKRIARLLAPYLERTPQRILEIMKNGKGIIFDNLSISNFQDLVKITRPVSPDLLYIQISAKLDFQPTVDILRLELNDSGGRAFTQDRDIPFHWGEALLVGCGRVYLDDLRRSGKNVLDLYLSRDRLNLRLWDATFQYKASGFDFDPLGEGNFKGMAARLAGAAPPDVRLSPTAARLLDSADTLPQRFESVNSYERYNRWLLLNYYGKRVKI